jgi:hypothetical protein
MSIKFDEHNLPYIDLESDYKIRLETGEDEISEADKEKARIELREIPEIVEKAHRELNKLLLSKYNEIMNCSVMVQYLFKLIKRNQFPIC